MRPFHAPGGAGEILARYSFLEPLFAGRRVLEVGAAVATGGATAVALAERGAAAILSVDDDAEEVARAEASSPHAAVRFAPTSALDALEPGQFDLVAVVDGAALAVSPDRAAALARLLAPRGHLAAALPVPEASGLARLAGMDGPIEVPSYESFVGALQAVFPVVEIATQAAAAGWVLAAVSDAAPELSVDGGFGGAPEAAFYVAVCGSEPSGLRGMCLVTLPLAPLADAAAGVQADRDRARGEADLARRDADTTRVERDRALEAADGLERERDALARELDEAREGAGRERAEAAEAARLLAERLRAEAGAAKAEADQAREAAGTARGEAETARLRAAGFAERAARGETAAREREAERDAAAARAAAAEASVAAAREAARASEARADALAAELADRVRVRDAERAEVARGAEAARAAQEALARVEQRARELETLARSQAGEMEIAHQEAARALAEAGDARARAEAYRFELDALRDRARGAEAELARLAADLGASAAGLTGREASGAPKGGADPADG